MLVALDDFAVTRKRDRLTTDAQVDRQIELRVLNLPSTSMLIEVCVRVFRFSPVDPFVLPELLLTQ